MATLTIDRTPEGWDATREGYDAEVAPFTGQFARSAFELAGLSPGSRVLDVAAGTGALALHAARAGMNVLATDFAPGMIAKLREHVREEGLRNLDTAVENGQSLGLADASFDAAFSIFGLIFFPDRAAGFRELHRVLRPGGVAVVTGWCGPDRFRVFGVIGHALREAVPDLPAPAEPPAALSLADPERFRSEFEAAGFKEVGIRTLSHPFKADSASAVLDRFQTAAPPLRALVENLGPDQLTAFRKAMLRLLEAEFGGGPVTLDCEAHVGIGRK